jgi:ribosomal RNA-processing protein 12
MNSFATIKQQGRGGSQGSSINDVLSALTEVIVSQSGTPHDPSPTEYFASIIAALKSSAEIEHLNELLQLLEAVVPQSNHAVVVSQYTVIRDICTQLLESSSSTKTHYICLSLLGRVMKMQETSESCWNTAKNFKLLNIFLAFLDYDTTPRLRKIAGTRLGELLQHHKQHSVRTARAYVGDFCTTVFANCKRNDYKRSLCVVEFLESSFGFFHDQDILKMFDSALNLQECEQPILIASLFKMFDCFFQSPYLTLPARQLCDHVLTPIVASAPKTTDMESIGFYCTAIASGMTKLHRLDRELSIGQLVPCIQTLLMRCEADYTQIHCAVGTALKRIIRSCIDSTLVRENVQLMKMSSTFGRDGVSSPLNSFFDNLLEVLQLRYQNAWIYILDAVRALFQQITGDDGRLLLARFVEKIADIYQAITAGFVQVPTSVDMALKETLGSALKSLGVVHFLQVVPFRIDPAAAFDPATDLDSSRDWLINVLHSNVKSMPCRLCDFHDTILVTAKVYNSEVKKSSSGNPNLNFLRTRVVQLWSLFPSFCTGRVTDIAGNFERFVPILQGAMADTTYPEILYHVVGGLTFLAKGAKDRCPGLENALALERSGDATAANGLTPEIVTLRKFASHFLPTLVTLIESLDSSDNTRFQPILQCISAWTSISPQSLITKLSKKLLQLLLTSSAMDAKAGAASGAGNSAAWMAVILTMIPHLSSPMVVLLYRTIKPLLSVHESVGMQKRAYSVLSVLLTHHSTLLNTIETRLQILEMITSSLLTCHVSARYVRMNCIESLLKGMSDSLNTSVDMEGEESDPSAVAEQAETQATLFQACQSIFGEVLICLKDSNKKSRDAALDLLKTVYSYTTVEQVLPQLYSGIVAETSGMRSAVIIGLCILITQKREDPVLLQNVSALSPTIMLLLQEQCVEQTRAILTFLKVCVSVLSEDMLLELVPVLLPNILGNNLGVQLKTKFSQRVRSIIRKLSQRLHEDSLRSFVPESDVALLDYICKQARRSRKKKDTMLYNQKLERMMIGDSDDDDGDSSDEEEEGGGGGATSRQGKSRAPQRVKAIKSSEAMDTDDLPSDLNDLLEGTYQVPSVFGGGQGAGKTEGKKRTAESSSMDVDDDDDDDFLVQVNKNGQVLVIPKLVKQPEKMEGDVEEKEITSVQAAKAAKALAISGASGIEPLSKKRTHEPGEEYRSKKAGGDVWKKGMLEPHAYFPLDAKLLTKKNQDQAVSHIGIAINGQATKTNKRQRVAAIMKQQTKGKVAQTLSRKQKLAAMKGRQPKK